MLDMLAKLSGALALFSLSSCTPADHPTQQIDTLPQGLSVSPPYSAPNGKGNGVELTYLANEGFMLRAGDSTVLIDAFVGQPYAGYPALEGEARRRLLAAEPPFDQVDLALISHIHGDHFQSNVACQFAAAAPNCVIVSSEEVMADLDTFCTAAEGAERRKVLPRKGHTEGIDVGDVHVDVLRLSHSSNKFALIQNLGHVITIGGLKVLHLGDAAMTASNYAPYELETLGLDVALVPYWYFENADGRALIRDKIRARVTVAMHVPTAELENTAAMLDRHFPEALLFRTQMESRRIEATTR